MGEVIAFPVQRTCFRCEHYGDSYCRLFDTPIESELHAAKDCAGFEVTDG